MLFFPVFAKLQPGRSPDLSLRPPTAIYAPCRYSCPITLISRFHNPFRMNTCKSVSKQTTLTIFRMNTYEKHRGWGAVMVNQLPSEFDVQTLRRSDVATFPRSDALFIIRSCRSLSKECLRTLLKSEGPALFLKTGGCIGFRNNQTPKKLLEVTTTVAAQGREKMARQARRYKGGEKGKMTGGRWGKSLGG
jgi:hypothetical protein